MREAFLYHIGERPVQNDQACLWHPGEHRLKELAVPVESLQGPRAAQPSAEGLRGPLSKGPESDVPTCVRIYWALGLGGVGVCFLATETRG